MKTCFFTLFNMAGTSTGQSYPIERGQTLLKNLLIHNISTQSKCGGKAICGHCRVKVLSSQSHCNKPVAEEKTILSELQIEQGWRLACQLYSLGNISLCLPSQDEIKEIIHPEANEE